MSLVENPNTEKWEKWYDPQTTCDKCHLRVCFGWDGNSMHPPGHPKAGKEKWECCNPDGSLHFKLCKETVNANKVYFEQEVMKKLDEMRDILLELRKNG